MTSTAAAAATITVIGRQSRIGTLTTAGGVGDTGPEVFREASEEGGASSAERVPTPGPLATLWDLLSAVLDYFGLTRHRRQLTSRGYRLLRHCVYSGCMALAMLLAIIVDCYLWAGDSGCGTSLQLWSVVTSAAVMYSISFRCLEVLRLLVLRQTHRDDVASALTPPPMSLRCKAVHHICCLNLTIIGLATALLFVFEFGLAKSKIFVILVAVSNSLLLTRCIKWLVKVLVELEQVSRVAERRAFRDRRPTFAELLEVQFMSNAEQRAAHVVQLQQVVPFDEDTFQDHPECCICSRIFDDTEEIRRTNCSHVFHSECLQQWFMKSHTCPLCRKDLSGRGQQPHQQQDGSQTGFGNRTMPAPAGAGLEDVRQLEISATGGEAGIPSPQGQGLPQQQRYVNVQLNFQLQLQMHLPPEEAPASEQDVEQQQLQLQQQQQSSRPHLQQFHHHLHQHEDLEGQPLSPVAVRSPSPGLHRPEDPRLTSSTEVSSVVSANNALNRSSDEVVVEPHSPPPSAPAAQPRQGP
mmetsp:Transcript_51134/g.121511  ORF Transcript_51134/g.121511 Transcript_51134/m.121511 type:complete len:523 (-) Transcript_51134:20-1588(-)